VAWNRGIYNEKITRYLSEIYCSCGRDYVDWCFWNVTSCNLADSTNISAKLTACVFRVSNNILKTLRAVGQKLDLHLYLVSSFSLLTNFISDYTGLFISP